MDLKQSFFGDFMKNGFIIINKDSGISSHTAVARVKRLLGAKKAGHTGTLDPLASGVLPILIERGVKASEYMICERKHYRARMLLGISTDTEDITGKIIEQSCYYPPESEILKAVSSFLGESMQTPPMYSALKIDGRKLYELAREGATVEREARKITVYDISAKKICDNEYELYVCCSGGTYIRTLIVDIARSAGALATMKSLHRTEAAGFGEEESITLLELEALSESEREDLVRPVEEIFDSYAAVNLSAFFARLCKNGLEIYLKKINLELEVGTRVKLFDENGFFAIGEVREFENGLAIKPLKQFEL